MLTKPTLAYSIDENHFLAKGLISAWLLNERKGINAIDSNKNYNGILLGGILQQGDWVSFNGSQYISLTNLAFPAAREGSLFCEFRATSSAASQRVFAQGNSGNSNNFCLQYSPLGGNTGMRGVIGGDGAAQVIGTTTANFGLNNWLKVAMVFKYGLLQIFVNGKLYVTDNAISATLGTGFFPADIGRKNDTTQLFSGDIKYCYLYGRGLSPHEVRLLTVDPYLFYKKPTLRSQFKVPFIAPPVTNNSRRRIILT